MASLKRPKQQRDDQPDMLGGPIVVHDRKTSPAKPTERAALLGKNNQIPSKADDETQDDQTDKARQNASSDERTKPSYVVKRLIDQVIRIGDACDGGGCRCVYVARNLLHVVVDFAAWYDVTPETMLVQFLADEPQAPVRECSLVTNELLDVILGKLVEQEQAYERGEIDEATYTLMRQRWAVVNAAANPPPLV